MKMKKGICFLLSALMSVGMLTGCGDEKKTEDTQNKDAQTTDDTNKDDTQKEDETYANGLSKTEEVTLKIAIGDLGNGTESYDSTIELFESMYPNVTIEATKTADIDTIIETKIAAGDDDDMFDILDDYKQTKSMYADLVAAGKYEILDDMWDYESNDTPGSTLADLTHESWKEFSYVGGWPDGEMHVACFPYACGGYGGLYFNKTLFEEKGWNQSPQTWQEFLDLCAEIKADGITPLVYTGVYSYYLDLSAGYTKLFELAEEAGDLDTITDVYRNYGDKYYTNDDNVKMWSKVSELGKLGYWHTGIAGMNHTQAQMQVIQGNVAMVSTGSWVGNEMADSTPEGFEWGYMILPMRETTDTSLYAASSDNRVAAIWAAKPEINKAWAKEFIRLMWDMSCQEAAAKVGTVSIRKDFADDENRLALYDDAIASAMKYTSADDVVLAMDGHFTAMTGSTFAQAVQLMSDSYTDLVSGNADVKATLEEAEALLDSAKEEN